MLQERLRNVKEWVDTHPRTGWYIAILVTLDVILDVVHFLG